MKKVLVIDDDALVRDTIVRILERKGYTVLVAAVAAPAQYRASARSMAHDDPHRSRAAAHGTPHGGAAGHPSGRCGRPRARNRELRPGRTPVRRDGYARPILDGAAPGRDLRADALVRPVFLGGTDRPFGRRSNRSGFGPARAEGDPR